MTFRQALAELWRQRLIVVAAVVAALLAAAAYTTTLTTTYSASAQVQTPVLPAGALPLTAPLGPQTQLVTSDQVLQPAARTLHVDDPSSLRGVLSASADELTGIVTIKATTARAGDAVAIVNAVANGYIRVRRGLDQQYVDDQEAQEAGLQNKIDRIRQQLQAHRGDSILSSQLNAATLQLTTVASNVQVMQSAPPSAAMLSQASGASANTTSKSQVFGLAFIIGLLAGCGLALLRSQFDTRVRTVEGTEEVSEQPVLAQLPYVRSYRRGATALPVVDDPRNPYAESIRELRTSAAVLLDQDKTPVVVITSPAPFDGKTLAVANLAASWALSGKHTVLVSGDLRRPRVQHFFGTRDSAQGLADLIADQPPSEQRVASMLRSTAIDGLSLLPSGRPKGDPADGLASHAMVRTVESLRSIADIVLVDSPPVLAVSDAAITATHADGVIVIVRAGRTKERELAEATKRLRSGGATVLGVALNRVKGVMGSAYGDYYRVDNADDDTEDDQTPVDGASKVCSYLEHERRHAWPDEVGDANRVQALRPRS